ncbi:MAG: flagellar hook capping FlgD N-terminal domain-containing protein [Myxococcota bacterium]
MNVLDSNSIGSAIQAADQKKTQQDKVGQSQFLDMLVAQLENQDPLNPQDSADFAAQLAQFSTVEQLVAMRTGVDDLVKAFKEQASGSSATSRLDPAGLIGREVTVIGSQVEVDSKGSPIELPLRMKDTAVKADVRITDGAGREVYKGSIMPVDENGQQLPLKPGDHTFRLDPIPATMPTGVYNVQFTAKNAAGQDVTILPMATGLVTGAVVTGDPAVRIGNRLFGLSDILEVRMASQTQSAGVQ